MSHEDQIVEIKAQQKRILKEMRSVWLLPLSDEEKRLKRHELQREMAKWEGALGWQQRAIKRRNDLAREQKKYDIWKAKDDAILKAKIDGCSNCGIKDPDVLEFHHLDPDEKRFSISAARRPGINLRAMLDEIEKCEILCANCHRKNHVQEFRIRRESN